jgi:hypothetical protein
MPPVSKGCNQRRSLHEEVQEVHAMYRFKAPLRKQERRALTARAGGQINQS